MDSKRRHKGPLSARNWLDIAALTVLCAFVFGVGLDRHGLTSWQEAMRALVARQMNERLGVEPFAWVVPRLHGEPYLAKPPLIYWAQIGLARLMGAAEPSVLHLRLSVALAGWLGVIGTYVLTLRLRMLQVVERAGRAQRTIEVDDSNAARALAWWASLLLATGVLYVRSSRIGELDILLVPTTLVAILGVLEAWRCAEATGRAHWGWILFATIGSTLAALAKGPPAILIVFVSTYGAMVVMASRRPVGEGLEPAFMPRLVSAAGMVMGGTFCIAALSNGKSAVDVIGIVLLTAAGAVLGRMLARIASPMRARWLWWIWSKTHPAIVVLVPIAVLVGWSRWVASIIGQGAVAAAAAIEAEDNLRVFVPESPVKNLEAAAYGVGLGSLLAVVALYFLLNRSPLVTKSWAIMAGWLGLGLVAFSTLGKGVPRYLTPVWPAIAILGSWGLMQLAARARRPQTLLRTMAAVTALSAAGQGWWYGAGQEAYYSDRSPRAIVSELLSSGVAASSLATFEFWTPAIDYYAGCKVDSFNDTRPREGLRFVGPGTLTELRATLASRGETRVMLIRSRQPGPPMEPKLAIACLEDAGFIVEDVPLKATFTIDNGRTPVVAVRISVPPDR